MHPGDWVAVSGLREPDGVIAASRIDQRMPGTVLVRGTAMPSAGGWRIGDLSVQPPNGASLAPEANITARGTMVNGGLSDTIVNPDVLSADPAAFFGGHVRRMVIESYVSAADGHLRLGRGWLAAPGKRRRRAGRCASCDRPVRTRRPWRLCRDPPARCCPSGRASSWRTARCPGATSRGGAPVRTVSLGNASLAGTSPGPRSCRLHAAALRMRRGVPARSRSAMRGRVRGMAGRHDRAGESALGRMHTAPAT